MPSPPGPPIPLGNPMEWEVTFLDGANAPFDPSTGIQIVIKDPDGGNHVFAYPALISKKSTGVYSATLTASIRGDWVGFGTGLLPDGTPVTTEQIAQKVF